jgi:hypothetical protein
MFETNLDGVPENKMNEPLPEGRYNLRIKSATEKVTKAGDPMVVVDYEVMDGPHAGRNVRFHNVVFFKDKERKGAGMSKTYLKTIGEPFEGQITVDSNRWIGKCLTAKTANEKGKDGNTYSVVKFVDKYIIDYTAPQSDAIDQEEDPFLKDQ